MTNFEKLAAIRLTQMEGAAETIAALRADNAKKDAALREIKNAVYGAQGYNATYAFIYTTACDALTLASQEAPASPAADERLIGTGITGPLVSVERGAKMLDDYAAPASPSPGLREAVTLSKACPCAKHSVELTVPSWLREAVIEECAKIADAEAAEQDELDLERTMRAETADHIADRIRALASRPVSEREAET